MNKEEIKKLDNKNLVAQLISHAHTFGDFVKETQDFTDEILCRLEPLVMPKIAEERFYTDGTSITGYYAIYDRTDEDKTLWIDCPNNYLPVIVKALNSNFSV